MNRKHIQDTFDYFLHFTEIYRTNENKYLREARILKLQIPHILQDFQKGDLLAGSIHHTFIGFSPQYGGKYIYFFEEDQARKLLDDNREFLSRIDEIEAAIAYWHTERTLYKLNDRFASKHTDWGKKGALAFPAFLMAVLPSPYPIWTSFFSLDFTIFMKKLH